MVDVQRITLPCVRHDFYDANGVFPEMLVAHSVFKDIIEDFEPLAEPNLGPERAEQHGYDSGPKVDPIYALESKAGEVCQSLGDGVIEVEIGFNDGENAELSWSKGSSCHW